MQASDIMTANPACVTPRDSARRAAQLMADHDCGCVPVVAAPDDRRVVGVVTDRDLALRGIGRGSGPDTPVSDLMTEDPCCCSPDADVREVERLMADRQLRRIMIADADGCCVGIVSQADVARAASHGRNASEVSDHEVAMVVEAISEPTRRAGQGAARPTEWSQEWRL